MAISKEKVDGWLVGYIKTVETPPESKIVFVLRFSVIPAVFLTFANRPQNWGDLNYDLRFNSGVFDFQIRWKSKLNFDEQYCLENDKPYSESILQERVDLAIQNYSDFENASLNHWEEFCQECKKCIRKSGGKKEACRAAFWYKDDFPESNTFSNLAPVEVSTDSALAPVSSLVYSDSVSAVPADSAPADSGQKKKRKDRIDLSPDLIKKIADDAAQNPGLTNGKLAKLYNLSDTPFRPGKPLRIAVDLARTGDLGRHAAKPDKPFNDEK